MLSLLNVLCNPLLSSSLGASHGGVHTERGPSEQMGLWLGPVLLLFSCSCFLSTPSHLEAVILMFNSGVCAPKALTISIWLLLTVLC